MVSPDPFAEFKAKQRLAWASFAPLEAVTTMPAAHLVRAAQVATGAAVLDVGCGTGVVAVTAARAGARVTGVDLTPALIEHARRNAQTAGLHVDLHEGDVEALPFPDATFDVVLSQFGHMFAPRPDVAMAEMLRVLRPGGRIAFSTWPPEHFTGQMFALTGRYLPPPQGAAPPVQWGDPNVVRQRLGDAVSDLRFERGVLWFPTLSAAHYGAVLESTGPLGRVAADLASDPAALGAFRREFHALIAQWFADNAIRQDYLLTRATKR
jgi:SAM-dependent methyltransferase